MASFPNTVFLHCYQTFDIVLLVFLMSCLLRGCLWPILSLCVWYSLLADTMTENVHSKGCCAINLLCRLIMCPGYNFLICIKPPVAVLTCIVCVRSCSVVPGSFTSPPNPDTVPTLFRPMLYAPLAHPFPFHICTELSTAPSTSMGALPKAV